ncbi:hypothetical protein BaRGS_00012425 [Batillaria attramentaria]|uniref:Uncharacterized protein n=1 Tax=Batillaria attramentaria TaxID=370345 RepID=A0ABD0LA95_9CAEN
MSGAVCLVQGASRGIGLGFCRALLARSPDTFVIATCRNPAAAPELRAVQDQNPDRVTVLPVDVMQTEQIQEAAEIVKEKHGRLDLLINSAGMLHPSGRGETSLKDVSAEGLEVTFKTNTIGPLLVAKHFAPLLVGGQGAFGEQAADSKNQHAAVLVNMSAKVGSITDNALGGWYSYRMSKAALNMATKNLSMELGRGRKKVICVSLHPGTVDTDLSRPYHKNVPNLFSVEDSVDSLMNVIDSLTVEDSGKFFTYDKTLMPF